MTTTEILSSHVGSANNGGSSNNDSSDGNNKNNISIYSTRTNFDTYDEGAEADDSISPLRRPPPPPPLDPLCLEEAALDIQALVNDAASASASEEVVVTNCCSDGSSSDENADHNGDTTNSNNSNNNNNNNNGIDDDEISPPSSAKGVALDILALENDAAAAAAVSAADAASSASSGGTPLSTEGSNVVGNIIGGLPFAPMMTYQKYLTMQVRMLLLLHNERDMFRLPRSCSTARFHIFLGLILRGLFVVVSAH